MRNWKRWKAPGLRSRRPDYRTWTGIEDHKAELDAMMAVFDSITSGV
ncbi:MAG: hypothetical protein LBC97_09145 [Bifidobacteriaceae bacterium]|nr:hypothetical protein [Bifidobacteriaceae bacterium]